MDEKIVVHLIIYGAVAGGILGLLGIGYIYRKWFRLPQIVDELAEAGLAKADYTFPVTLNVAGRVAAKDELSLHFFHKATIQASHTIPYNTKSYFEVEIIYLPSTTRLYVGLAPRSLNEELIPGCTMNTVAAECQQGIVICEGSPSSIDAPLLPGDTLGILAFHGELLNLRVLRDGKVGWAGTRINIRLPLLPTIHATGPCTLRFNFGQTSFKYAKANVHQLGLANSPYPESPPIYVNYSLPPFEEPRDLH
ncbi:Protein ssh4 [Entomophthora muscae]|uniref:Protein ssh4 n=1 Tax=Entomophthora muscae TaxID=34485 RepID=A0ACC2TD55_9FUNG|nr:Protein ssh4 [Entomophthora muscae]